MIGEDFDFSQLETDVSEEGKFSPRSGAKTDNRERFPCEHCDGTGKYRRVRVHQPAAHCFACKGKGYFFKSKHDRLKARAKAAGRKARKLEEALAAFDEKNPGLREFLYAEGTRSNFAASVSEKLHKYGGLTENQIAAALSLRDMAIARAAEKAAKDAERARTEQMTTPTLARMAEAFLAAGAALKFPKLRLMTEDGERVVLTRCGDRSKTPGHINITDGAGFEGGRYFGRLTPDGRALYRDDTPQSVRDLLLAFNDDPEKEMKIQGQRTGACCLCGQELTNPSSIEAGIGPICAGKWGF